MGFGIDGFHSGDFFYEILNLAVEFHWKDIEFSLAAVEFPSLAIELSQQAVELACADIDSVP